LKKIKDLPALELQALAGAANLKPNILRSLFGDLDTDLRDGKAVVIGAGGATMDLRDHLGALEDGADILRALDAGEANSDGESTGSLDTYMARRYGHNLPSPGGARVDTQDVPASLVGNGIPFPAQGGLQGAGTPVPLAGLDNWGARRYGHNLSPKGDK
jgi:hypothetical protein